MSGRIAVPPLSDERNRTVLPMGYVRGLLDKVEKALLVAERNGDLLLVNSRAKQLLGSYGLSETPGLNLFGDFCGHSGSTGSLNLGSCGFDRMAEAVTD